MILFLLLLVALGIIFVIIDVVLYYIFTSFVSDPMRWIFLIPFIIIELLLFLGIMLLINVPFAVFLKYQLLSFLEAWFAGADIPFFDAPAPGTEIGLSESQPTI